MFKVCMTVLLFLPYFSLADQDRFELWSGEKTALAFCITGTASSCFIVVDKLEIDVSQVENSNIGKLGITRKEDYQKVTTFPQKWMKSDKAEMIVLFKTEAWLDDKRYSVVEPVLVKNGKYIQR